MNADRQSGDANFLLVLVGMTAGWRKRRALGQLLAARSPWPVILPWLPYTFGLRFSARWLRFVLQRRLSPDARLHVLAFIGGAAVLRQLNADGEAPRIARLVLARSQFQENVPRALMTRFPTWLVVALGGRSSVDIAEAVPMPLPRASLGVGVIVETKPSWLAQVLGLSGDLALPLNTGLEWPEPEAMLHLPLSHDEVYSAPALVDAALAFFRDGAFSRSGTMAEP